MLSAPGGSPEPLALSVGPEDEQIRIGTRRGAAFVREYTEERSSRAG